MSVTSTKESSTDVEEFHTTQWTKSSKKQSVGVYFDNMALYFDCRINKNAWRFCPLGNTHAISNCVIFTNFV